MQKPNPDKPAEAWLINRAMGGHAGKVKSDLKFEVI
jgi:hypothetical protein